MTLANPTERQRSTRHVVLWVRHDSLPAVEDTLHPHEESYHYIEPSEINDEEDVLQTQLINELGNGMFPAL